MDLSCGRGPILFEIPGPYAGNLQLRPSANYESRKPVTERAQAGFKSSRLRATMDQAKQSGAALNVNVSLM